MERMRESGRNFSAGLLGGVAAGLVLVAIETCLIALWWADLPIAPPALARTRMFDFFSEFFLFSVAGSGSFYPSFADGVYAARSGGLLRLAGGLLACVLPWAAALGILFACLQTWRGKKAGAALAGLFVVCACAVLDLLAWAFSIHFPSKLGPYVILRNIVRSFLFDGEWVSALALGLSASLFLLLGGRARLRLGPSGGTLVALLVAALSAVGFLSGGALARKGGALRASVERTGSAAASASAVAVRRPNIVLISIDSLRADHLGCYGWKHDTSPSIDLLASRGVRFARAWATTSWTLPSHVSMLTGRSLLGHGVLESGDAIPPSVPLLAEQLKSLGYRTAAFVSAPYLSSAYGFSRGFDLYDDRTVSFDSHQDSHQGTTSPALNRAVEKWLRSRGPSREAPFFLFVHYWDVHYDYTPPAPFDRMFDPDYRGSVTAEDFVRNPLINRKMPKRDLEHVLALYDGEIRFTDKYVGRLLALLEELQLDSDTMVILTADHGDEFFEHGNKSHQRTLYEEVLHVPLIVSWPGVIEGGRVFDVPVSTLDIVPTVLGVVGLAPAPGTEGRDLFGSSGEEERILGAELYRKSSLNLQVALRLGPYKLIQSLNYPRLEVFDLASDPVEQRRESGAKAQQKLTLALERWLDQHWNEAVYRDARAGKQTARVSTEHIEALRALGYLE